MPLKQVNYVLNVGAVHAVADVVDSGGFAGFGGNVVVEAVSEELNCCPCAEI